MKTKKEQNKPWNEQSKAEKITGITIGVIVLFIFFKVFSWITAPTDPLTEAEIMRNYQDELATQMYTRLKNECKHPETFKIDSRVYTENGVVNMKWSTSNDFGQIVHEYACSSDYISEGQIWLNAKEKLIEEQRRKEEDQ